MHESWRWLNLFDQGQCDANVRCQWNLRVNHTNYYIPRSTILPNKFFPRKKFFVEQFHRRLRNWCWHSEMARFAPLTSAANTPGFSRTSRRCLRRSVVCMAGSMYTMFDVNGDILFGSPTFAMPLFRNEKKRERMKKIVWILLAPKIELKRLITHFLDGLWWFMKCLHISKYVSN